MTSTISASQTEDNYITGYATALIEREFNFSKVDLIVKNGVVTVCLTDTENFDKDKIINILHSIEDVVDVMIIENHRKCNNNDLAALNTANDYKTIRKKSQPINPVIAPRKSLFDPLLADPRWPQFSLSYLYYNEDGKTQTLAAANIGETLNLYRNRAPFGGQWMLGLQASVYAIFDLDLITADLINADYLVSCPITYRLGKFSSQLRLFHISSHLGDEYMMHNDVKRKSLTYEAVDALISYDLYNWLRVYGGGGYLVRRFPEEFKPKFIQYGFELQSPYAFLGQKIRPIIAADFKSWEENNWGTNTSLHMGLQLEDSNFLGSKMQLLFKLYNGNSPNGQFYKDFFSYKGIGFHFYF